MQTYDTEQHKITIVNSPEKIGEYIDHATKDFVEVNVSTHKEEKYDRIFRIVVSVFVCVLDFIMLIASIITLDTLIAINASAINPAWFSKNYPNDFASLVMYVFMELALITAFVFITIYAKNLIKSCTTYASYSVPLYYNDATFVKREFIISKDYQNYSMIQRILNEEATILDISFKSNEEFGFYGECKVELVINCHDNLEHDIAMPVRTLTFSDFKLERQYKVSDDTEYGKMPINIDFVRKVVCFNYMPKAGLEFPNDRRIVICSNVK